MKTYKTQRYLFFWLAIATYFIPVVVTTACLLPFMAQAKGMKWGIGIAVVALHSLGFVGGIFRGLRAHFPFINTTSFLFLVCALFFTADVFHDYVYSFMTIALVSFVSGIAACILWMMHEKYKRQSQTIATVLKSGLLKEMQGGEGK